MIWADQVFARPITGMGERFLRDGPQCVSRQPEGQVPGAGASRAFAATLKMERGTFTGSGSAVPDEILVVSPGTVCAGPEERSRCKRFTESVLGWDQL